jgi:beta-lactamase regulating signal transducer with metallopeptidase domain
MWLIALAMLLVPVSRLVVLPEQSSLPLAVTPERAVTQYVITSEEELDRVGGIPVSQNANQNSMEYIQQSQSPISAVISVFTIFYPLGVLMVLGYYIAGFAVFAGYFSRRNIPAPEKEYELLKELRGKGGVPKLYRSPLASTPMLIGLLRPKIILPEREYSDAQLHAILTHELMHLRRMDILVRWLSVIACAVHWFNPIVWLVRREIDRVCELSCDEAVIKNLDPKGRQRYGDTLIYAAADCKTPRVVITTTMCEEKRNLKERLSAIMQNKKRGALAIIISALLVAGLIACGVFLGAGSSPAGSIVLHETPQRYVLADAETYGSLIISSEMPTVTLYEAGTARLSQPMISSFGLFEMGSYETKDGELTVSQQGAEVVFDISDDGDTLTIKSSTLQFTNIGSVYKYQSSEENLSQYEHVEGAPLTLETLRGLAKSPLSITPADFEKYEHTVIDPDYYVLSIDGEYTVRVILDADGNTSCNVERLSDGATFPLTLNGSTGYVFEDFLGEESIPVYSPQEWLDFYYSDDMPWGESREITLPEFSDVTFIWTPEGVTDGENMLLSGMPVWNVYFADLTNDGKPEICATVSVGSGIVDTRVIVHDYVSGEFYELSDRMSYDYYLTLQDGKLMVTTQKYADNTKVESSELRIIKGELR